jgi:hypothetical protein
MANTDEHEEDIQPGWTARLFTNPFAQMVEPLQASSADGVIKLLAAAEVGQAESALLNKIRELTKLFGARNKLATQAMKEMRTDHYAALGTALTQLGIEPHIVDQVRDRFARHVDHCFPESKLSVER